MAEINFSKDKIEGKKITWYKNQNWVLARRCINDLRDKFGGVLDQYYTMMGKRMEQLEKENLSKDWDGVYRATTK